MLTGSRPNPLIVHAVSDSTGLKSYIPAARGFLRHVRAFDLPVKWISDRDLSLADYLAWLAYDADVHINAGKHAVFGVCSAYPEMLNNIPLTRRALQSWDRLAITGEGQATSFEACAVIAQNLRQNGEHDAADICLISTDMYLRSANWQN